MHSTFFLLIICPYYYMLLYASPLPLFFRVGKSEWIRDSERMERARVTVLQSEEREREKKRKSQKRLDGRMVDGWMDDGRTNLLFFLSYSYHLVLSTFGHTIYTLSTYIIAIFYSILLGWIGCVCWRSHSLTSLLKSSPVHHHITSLSFFLSISFSDGLWYVFLCSIFFSSSSPAFFLLYSFSISFTLSRSLCVWVEWSESGGGGDGGPLVLFFLMCVFPFSFFTCSSYYWFLFFPSCLFDVLCDTYGWQVSTEYNSTTY